MVAQATAAITPVTTIAGPSQPVSAVPLGATNQVLIQWRSATAKTPAAIVAQTTQLQEATGLSLQYVRPIASGAQLYRLPAGVDTASAIAQLSATPGVATVEPDIWMTPVDDLSYPTNDPLGSSMWGLLGSAQGPDSKYGIDAIDAWPTTTGAGVVVSVIDTGLLFDDDNSGPQVDHPDLVGQYVPGYDLISDVTTANDGNGRDAYADDPGDWCHSTDSSSWHGTHVAGTIAAVANNNLGVFGGAPEAKVQPVRVLGKCGGSMSDVIDGIYWAAGSATVSDGNGGYLPVNPYADCATSNPCVRVLNLSLGGTGTCSTSSSLYKAIDYARSRGKVVVVAAGNNGSNVAGFSPANCSNAFTVAAVGQSGKRSSFSNYGTVKSPDVDIAAPGVAVLSTLNSGHHQPDESGSGWIYEYYDGTSMATPHVALTAALVAAENPALTPDQIEDILRSTATPFPADGTRHSCSHSQYQCGSGIVNAAAAVAAAVPPGSVPDAPTGVEATPGDGVAAVSWTAPTNDGGSDIIGYTVTSQPDGLQCTTAGTLSCTVTGLQSDGTVSYTFTVTATNGIGTGPASDPSDPPVTPNVVSPAADTDPPAIEPPAVTIDPGQNVGATVALHVTWPAAIDASGIAQYLLESKIDGGRWTTVTLSPVDATTVDLTVAPGSSFSLRLAASDTVGNWSSWAGPTAVDTLSLVQEKPSAYLSYTGRWRNFKFAGALGGKVKGAGAAGRKAKFTFTGTNVAWVGTLAPSRGIAQVSVDGGPLQQVDLYQPSYELATIVWASGPLPDGPHTVVIRVTGTKNAASANRRVDVDAFLTY